MFDKLLPKYWGTEKYSKNYIIIKAYSNKVMRGCITVDFKNRQFRLGVSIFGNNGTKKYLGRGWRGLLVKDAIEYLKEVI